MPNEEGQPSVGDYVNVEARKPTSRNGVIVFVDYESEDVQVMFIDGDIDDIDLNHFDGHWTDKFGGLWRINATGE